MPTPRKPARADKTTVRRIQLGGGAGYYARVVNADGEVAYVERFARFAEEAILTPAEEARLDHLAALAPIGATEAQVRDELEKRIQAYTIARQKMVPVE